MAAKAYYTASFTHGVEKTDVPHPFQDQFAVLGALKVHAATKMVLDVRVRTINPTTLGVTVWYCDFGTINGSAAVVPGSGADTVSLIFVPVPPA